MASPQFREASKRRQETVKMRALMGIGRSTSLPHLPSVLVPKGHPVTFWYRWNGLVGAVARERERRRKGERERERERKDGRARATRLDNFRPPGGPER